jgi:hypothetical protein
LRETEEVKCLESKGEGLQTNFRGWEGVYVVNITKGGEEVKTGRKTERDRLNLRGSDVILVPSFQVGPEERRQRYILHRVEAGVDSWLIGCLKHQLAIIQHRGKCRPGKHTGRIDMAVNNVKLDASNATFNFQSAVIVKDDSSPALVAKFKSQPRLQHPSRHQQQHHKQNCFPSWNWS